MITFKRDGTKVTANISSELTPTANIFLFSWNCADECYADLLKRYLEERLEAKIQKIRKDSYEQGYKDAKAKRKKENWFSRWF